MRRVTDPLWSLVGMAGWLGACSSLTEPGGFAVPTQAPPQPSEQRRAEPPEPPSTSKEPLASAPASKPEVEPSTPDPDASPPGASSEGGDCGPGAGRDCPVEPTAACVQFGAFASRGLSVSLGEAANTVTLVDLDANGLADIVASHELSNTLSVSLNFGGGRFAPAVRSSTAGHVVSVTALPAGEWAELAVLFDSGTAEVFRHAGGGALTSLGTWAGSSEPMLVDFTHIGYLSVAEGSRLAAARVDPDAASDLVIANEDAGIVSVLRSEGAGFAPPVSYAASEAPHSVALADLDADGTNDIVTVDLRAGVGVLLNTGDGTFGAFQGYPAGELPLAARIGDLNGDGLSDIAVANGSGASGITVLFNLGEGRLAEPIRPENVYLASDLALTDVNEDGALDVIAIHGMTSSSVLFNDGAGVFTAETREVNSAGPVRTALGNIDGDSSIDLVVTDSNIDGSVGLWLDSSQPDRTAAPVPDTYFIGGSPYERIVAADLDGENGRDVVVSSANAPSVNVLLNDGSGRLGEPRWYGVDVFDGVGSRGALAVADLNGDAAPDLVVANTLLFNRGDGTFAEPLIYVEGQDPSSVAAADFDRDGDIDIVRADVEAGQVVFDRNDGRGSFAAANAYAVGDAPVEIALADVDRDDSLDVVVLRQNGLALLLGQEDGSFRAGASVSLGGYQRALVVADFSADGSADIAISRDQQILILINDGAARFSERIEYDISSYRLSAGDLNGDGLQDLASARGAGVSVLFNWEGRLIPLPQSYATDGESYLISLEDLNRDGAPDVILGSDLVAGVSVQLSTPCSR